MMEKVSLIEIIYTKKMNKEYPDIQMYDLVGHKRVSQRDPSPLVSPNHPPSTP